MILMGFGSEEILNKCYNCYVVLYIEKFDCYMYFTIYNL